VALGGKFLGSLITQGVKLGTSGLGGRGFTSSYAQVVVNTIVSIFNLDRADDTLDYTRPAMDGVREVPLFDGFQGYTDEYINTSDGPNSPPDGIRGTTPSAIEGSHIAPNGKMEAWTIPAGAADSYQTNISIPTDNSVYLTKQYVKPIVSGSQFKIGVTGVHTVDSVSITYDFDADTVVSGSTDKFFVTKLTEGAFAGWYIFSAVSANNGSGNLFIDRIDAPPAGQCIYWQRRIERLTDADEYQVPNMLHEWDESLSSEAFQRRRTRVIECWGDSLTPIISTSENNWTTALTRKYGRIEPNGVGGETSTQIKTRFIADTAQSKHAHIIWAGNNNVTDAATVKADIAEMVALIGHDKFIIVGVILGDYPDRYIGGVNRPAIDQLITDLGNTYPDNFINMHSILHAGYDSGIPQDVIDHDNGVTPSSLRTDDVHLNEAGQVFVSDAIKAFIDANGWVDSEVIPTQVLTQVEAGAERRPGQRLEKNLITNSENLDDGNWAEFSSAAITGAKTFSFASGINGYIQGILGNQDLIPIGEKGSVLAFLSSTVDVDLRVVFRDNSSLFNVSVVVSLVGGAAPKEFWFEQTSPYVSTGRKIQYQVVSPSQAGVITVGSTGLYNLTNKTSKLPPVQVSVGIESAPHYHGAGVDGLKYFQTANDDVTVDGSGVVTRTGTQTAIPDADMTGVFMEGAGGNLVRKPIDASYGDWSKVTGCTVDLEPVNDISRYKVTAGSGGFGWICLRNSLNYASSTPLSVTFVVEKGNYRYIGMVLPNSMGKVGESISTFDFDTMAWVTVYENVIARHKDLGGGKVAISLSYDYTSETVTSQAMEISLCANSTGDTSSTPAGTEYFYFYSAMKEESIVPTSFTPLATREADNNYSFPLAGLTDGTEARTHYFELTPEHDFADLPATDVSIITLNGSTTTGLLYHKANHKLASYDGTNSTESALTVTAGTTIKVAVEFLLSGDVNIYINEILDGTGTWDLDNDVATLMELCKGYGYGMSIKRVRITDGAFS